MSYLLVLFSFLIQMQPHYHSGHESAKAKSKGFIPSTPTEGVGVMPSRRKAKDAFVAFEAMALPISLLWC
ncbi:MAG: hypothetical protein EBS18_02850 [Actinobacteria bacterium]|nr:hypothetical protein [Actinomycetota bacterium]